MMMWISERRSGCRLAEDRKSTRLNSSHSQISYAVFCLKKKKNQIAAHHQPLAHYADSLSRPPPTTPLHSPQTSSAHALTHPRAHHLPLLALADAQPRQP